jgi:hypothetical protein
MNNTLEINTEIYKVLVESFGEKTLKEKLDDILLSAIEGRLKEFTDNILKFEEKYGVSFDEFEKMWDSGKIRNKYSYDVESDFIDWEMLEMEKSELLLALSKIKSLKEK